MESIVHIMMMNIDDSLGIFMNIFCILCHLGNNLIGNLNMLSQLGQKNTIDNL